MMNQSLQSRRGGLAAVSRNDAVDSEQANYSGVARVHGPPW